MVSIYVAGSSRERERVGDVFRWIERNPGMKLMQNWLATIDSYGDLRESDLPSVIRQKHVWLDLGDVKKAKYIWLLAPTTITRGAWVEYGYALALQQIQPDRYDIIVSGPSSVETIFCAVAKEFKTDAEAFGYILAQEGLK